MNPLKELGNRALRARSATGLTLAELAAKAFLPPERIASFEQGESSLGSAEALRLARALGVPAPQLLHTSVPAVVGGLSPDVLLKRAAFGADLDPNDRKAIAEGLNRANGMQVTLGASGFDDAVSVFDLAASAEGNPWSQGYRLALQARALLPERADAIRDLRRLVEDRFGVLVVDVRFTSEDVLGAAARLGQARVIAVNSRLKSETTRRFVLAHELEHHIADLKTPAVRADTGDAENERFFMGAAPEEQRANAFAAMFLAPTATVHAALGQPGRALDTAEARNLAVHAMERFGIGYAASVWHLKNLKYWDDAMVSSLLMLGAEAASGFETPSRFDGLQRRVLFALSRDLITRARARELVGESLDSLDAADLRP